MLKLICGKCDSQTQLKDYKIWCKNCGCCVILEEVEE